MTNSFLSQLSLLVLVWRVLSDPSDVLLIANVSEPKRCWDFVDFFFKSLFGE